MEGIGVLRTPRVLRTTPETFPTLRVSSFMRLNQMRLGQLCFGGFLREFSPQTKVLRTWLKYRRLLPCEKGNTMLVFFWGVFLVACRSELAHFKTPEGGKGLPFFCWLLAGRSSLIFKPFKEGEMLVNLLGGVFLLTCRSEWAILKPLKGENSCQISCWLLADRNF